MKISISYMAHVSTATVRVRRLRARRSRGIAMVAPVEVGEGGVALLIGNGLLKQHQAGDRNAVGAACLSAPVVECASLAWHNCGTTRSRATSKRFNDP